MGEQTITDPLTIANTIQDELIKAQRKIREEMVNKDNDINIDISTIPIQKKLNDDNIFKEVSEEETEILLNSCKGTAPNSSKFRSKTVKYMTPTIQRYVFKIINHILDKGEVPLSMKICTIIPILKKDKDPISLLDSVYKMTTKLITMRLENLLSQDMSIGQTGGKRGQTTHNRIATVQNIISHANNKGKLYFCF